MTNRADAFLSYTRVDDKFVGGSITSLREFLELGVQVVTGHRDFTIFQDIEGIEFGQRWQKRLDEELASTRFLIPIVTPLFFESPACRDELQKFIAHEKEQNRDDLILPIYFATAPVLERPDLLRAEQLAIEISKRQRYDWRPNADLPMNDPRVRSAVRDLANKIGAAIARTSSLPVEAATPQERREIERKKDAALEQASESMRSEAGLRKSKHKKILWVDDRPDNNIFERRAMQAYNIDFDLAESTGKAIAKLRKSKYDAIISDMGRPPDEQAGYTLLDALRSSGDLTPYFIYAGSDSPEHRELALSKGAQGSTNSSSKLIEAVLKSV